MAVRIGEIDALLQGLEQILEASFVFAFRGDIARQNTHTALDAFANGGLHGALEISGDGFMLQANAQDTGPMMPLEQARQFLLH